MQRYSSNHLNIFARFLWTFIRRKNSLALTQDWLCIDRIPNIRFRLLLMRISHWTLYIKQRFSKIQVKNHLVLLNLQIDLYLHALITLCKMKQNKFWFMNLIINFLISMHPLNQTFETSTENVFQFNRFQFESILDWGILSNNTSNNNC